ncbi:MAG: hypothetical protein QG604_309 [Candidatus Dependentiae bacterium]|nr:hypothetical protein [Candidatus Dependentiae bacterium]
MNKMIVLGILCGLLGTIHAASEWAGDPVQAALPRSVIIKDELLMDSTMGKKHHYEREKLVDIAIQLTTKVLNEPACWGQPWQQGKKNQPTHGEVYQAVIKALAQKRTAIDAKTKQPKLGDEFQPLIEVMQQVATLASTPASGFVARTGMAITAADDAATRTSWLQLLRAKANELVPAPLPPVPVQPAVTLPVVTLPVATPPVLQHQDPVVSMADILEVRHGAETVLMLKKPGADHIPVPEELMPAVAPLVQPKPQRPLAPTVVPTQTPVTVAVTPATVATLKDEAQAEENEGGLTALKATAILSTVIVAVLIADEYARGPKSAWRKALAQGKVAAIRIRDWLLRRFSHTTAR